MKNALGALTKALNSALFIINIFLLFYNVVIVKIPKIEFRYSKVYLEQLLGCSIDDDVNSKLKGFVPLYHDYWEPYAEKIPLKLSEITGLAWKEEQILCYIVGKHRSFSDPLSIKTWESGEPFLYDMTHELIHRLLSVDNYGMLERFWSWARDKYGDEGDLVVNHIPVHAVQTELLLGMSLEKLLDWDRSRSKRPGSEAYARAWEIVDREGYKNIIEKIRTSAK